MLEPIVQYLHAHLPKPCYGERPFVCDGLPERCVIMVVGENPAMQLGADWWSYWSDVSGFNLEEFEREFERRRSIDKERYNSFLRLKRFRESGLRTLETNLFRNERKGGNENGISNEALLKLFLSELPHLKAVVTHGKQAENFFLKENISSKKLVFRPLRAFRMESYKAVDGVIDEISKL